MGSKVLAPMIRTHDRRSGPGSKATLPSEPATLGRDFAPNLALPWVVRLRYGIACGVAAIILGMAFVFHLTVPLFWMFAILSVVVGTNLVLSKKPQVSTRFPQATLGAIFVLDTLCLTVMLGLTGGSTNPFSLLYLVQITLSAVVLKKTWTWALGVLATVCFGLLFLFHVPAPAFETHHDAQGLSPHLVGMWVAFIVAAGLITFFTGKVSDGLREREHQVLTLQEQIAKNERLASLATLAAGAAHELGTPLGTIAVVSRGAGAHCGSASRWRRYARRREADSFRSGAVPLDSPTNECRGRRADGRSATKHSANRTSERNAFAVFRFAA